MKRNASAAPKIVDNASDVPSFLASIADEQMREDCLTLIDLMTAVTRCEAKMWGSGIVGFGKYRYQYESGREGEWFLTGFAPRKANLSLYLLPSCSELGKLPAKLGKFTTGKSCLYVKRLADIDMKALKQLIASSVAGTRKKFPSKASTAKSPPRQGKTK